MRRLLIVVTFVAALVSPVPVDAGTRHGAPMDHPIAVRIVAVFGPTYGPRAARIAWCESKYKAHAISSTNDHGIFQLHAGDGTWAQAGVTWATVYNAEANIQGAHRLFLKRGFGPWNCRG